MLRRLRITASVFFAVLTVLLCVLWVRSNWWNDIVSRVDSNYQLTTLGSKNGYVYVYRIPNSAQAQATPLLKPHGWKLGGAGTTPGRTRGFSWTTSASQTRIAIPYWFLTAIAFTAACLPWVKRRFSLRGMFIVATLVAIVIGLGLHPLKAKLLFVVSAAAAAAVAGSVIILLKLRDGPPRRALHFSRREAIALAIATAFLTVVTYLVVS